MPSAKKRSQRKVSNKRSTIKRSQRKGSNKRSLRKRSSRAKPQIRIPVLHKGSLSKYGWSSSKNKDERHKALRKASKEFTSGELIKKLNLLAIYNKKRNPALVDKVHVDMHYIQTQL